MEWYFVLLIVLGSILLLYIIGSFVLSIFLSTMMVHPAMKSKEQIYSEWDKRIYDLNKFDNEIDKEEYFVKSKYGYNLKVIHVKPYEKKEFSDGKKRVAIMVHGWTSNYYTMLSYANIYLKRGFEVYLYAHRHHIGSDIAICTMGDKEADDLQTIVEHVKEKEGSNIVLGTHGESMGAGTTMIHAGRYHSIDFAVEDCGYASMYHLLKFQCAEIRKLPVYPLLWFFNLLFLIRTHTSHRVIRPYKEVSTLDDIPMLFVHGDADMFVPTDSAYINYDAKSGYKKIKIFANSGHAKSVLDHNEEYEQLMDEYLKDINVIEK